MSTGAARRRHRTVVPPHDDLGDAGAEVDGEDHAGTARPVAGPGWQGAVADGWHRARSRRRGAAIVAGSGSWNTTRPTARPGRPAGHGVADLARSHASRPEPPWPRPSRGPPRKSTGTPTLATTRATASTRRRARVPRRGRAPSARGAEVVGHDRGEHDRVGVPGHLAVAPRQRLDERLEPGDAADFQHLARAAPGRRAVTGSAMSMRVMCLTPVHPSAAACSTVATSRSSSSNALPASPVRLSDR